MSILIKFAKRFIAGEKAEEAIEAIKKLNSKGLTTTLDILGEDVKEKGDALKSADSYIQLLDMIKKEGVSSNVSLKLTQLGLDINTDFCAKNLESILLKAKECDNFVRIDMEGSAHTQKTLDTFYNLHKKYDNVGCVIQAYLYRSEKDIQKLIRENAIVRLCKGAYKEPKTIAFKKKKQVNQNFTKLMHNLLLNGNYPAIATHDEKIIKNCKELAEEKSISKNDFEFQMLYGIRPKLQEQLAEEGYNTRIYVPFGTHWMPYTIRRLKERKENTFFVLKNLFKK